MKNIIIAMAIFTSIVSCSKAQSTFSEESLGATLLTTDNQKKDFKSIVNSNEGEVTVYEFWASWCSDCVKSMDKFKELQKANPDVNYVFISLDKTPEKWLVGIEKHQLKGEHYLVIDAEGMKGKFGQSIKLDWIPRFIITNKKGEIVLFRAIEKDFDKMHETLQTLK